MDEGFAGIHVRIIPEAELLKYTVHERPLLAGIGRKTQRGTRVAVWRLSRCYPEEVAETQSQMDARSSFGGKLEGLLEPGFVFEVKTCSDCPHAGVFSINAES